MKEYPLLKQAYNFEDFQKNGHQILDQLTEYLQNQQGDFKANNWKNPNSELSFWHSYEFSNVENFIEDLINHSIHLHNPKYIGHQVSVPAPLSALMNLVSGVLNNGMAVYEMGPAATAIEKCIIELFCNQVGYDSNANGVMTSGGTLANLTGLLAARRSLKGQDIWKNGNKDKLAILVSSQAHYSVDRAARVMGLGDDGVVLVPVNSGFSMDIEEMKRCYAETIDSGFKVIAIVGSACSTATGSYDDLEQIGQFCQQNGVWLHVDGAHGGAAIFSNQHKNLLKGLEMADSIIIDTHKMMMTPALSTVVLFKDKRHGSRTFTQKAQYLFEDQALEEQWYNGGLRTFECTKFMICLKFYILWKTYGIKIFEENIDYLYGLGQTFSEMVKQHNSFQLALEPQTNIVCFRYIDDDLTEDQLNQLNKKIRQQLLEDNEFYIVQTVLNDTHYLRVTIMNPLTTEKHMNNLLEKICQIAETI